MELNISSKLQNISTENTNMDYTVMHTIKAWIYTVVGLIVLSLGTFGNIMILLILRRLGPGTTHIFLRSLAVSDLCLMYSGFFSYWMFYTFNIIYVTLHDVVCKLVVYVQYSSGVLSAWFVVAMTVQRALSVVWPHRVNIMCTRKKTLTLILGITCFVLVMHLHIFYGYSVAFISNSSSTMCTSVNKEYIRFMSKVWSWVDLLSFSLLPFSCLVVSNTGLVWNLKASMNNVTLTAGQSEQSSNREKNLSSITVTLLAVSVTFLILTLPNSIFLIIYPYVLAERSDRDVMFAALVNLIDHFTLLLWFSNSSFSFYIYCLTGSKFRAETKKMLFGCCPQIPVVEIIPIQNSRTSNISNSTPGVNVLESNEEF